MAGGKQQRPTKLAKTKAGDASMSKASGAGKPDKADAAGEDNDGVNVVIQFQSSTGDQTGENDRAVPHSIRL
jgi:hypothetical protein